MGKMLQHKINISVKKPDNESQSAIRAGEKKIHKRFLRWLLGDEMNILVVSPGPSVRTVEIHEILVDDATGEVMPRVKR